MMLMQETPSLKRRTTAIGESDHQRIFNAGDDLDRTAAELTSLDVDAECPLKALRPHGDQDSGDLSHASIPLPAPE